MRPRGTTIDHSQLNLSLGHALSWVGPSSSRLYHLYCPTLKMAFHLLNMRPKSKNWILCKHKPWPLVSIKGDREGWPSSRYTSVIGGRLCCDCMMVYFLPLPIHLLHSPTNITPLLPLRSPAPLAPLTHSHMYPAHKPWICFWRTWTRAVRVTWTFFWLSYYGFMGTAWKWGVATMKE